MSPHFGTPTYMAPEQYQMKTITKQVDIWAFGCVLYEMVTGRSPFQADTFRQTATLVLESEPDWSSLSFVPERLLDLIQRCLQKDRRIRLHDIADARIEIEQLIDGTAVARGVTVSKWMPSRRQLLIAASGFAGGVLLGRLLPTSPRVESEIDPYKFSIAVTNTNSITQISVSPRGRRIAYVAGNQQGTRVIWVRELMDTSPRMLPGTDDPSGLFWSPDEETIGFFNSEELRIVDLFGRNVRTVTSAPGATTGSWGRSGEVLIDSTEGRGLYRVSVENGTRIQFTSPDPSQGERHYQPQFLPDGVRFLFLVKTALARDSGVYLGSLDSDRKELVVRTASKAMFAEPSHLFFVREGVLMTQQLRLDPVSLIGEPTRLAEQVSVSAISGSAAFGVSYNRIVAFRSGSSFQNSRLAWYGREGNEGGEAAEPAIYTQVSIAPDGKHAALERRHPYTGFYDIWLADLVRKTSTRLTLGEASERHPTWLSDSRQIVFTSDSLGVPALYRQGIETTEQPQLVLKENELYHAMGVFQNTLLLRDEGVAFYTFPLDNSQQHPQVFLKSSFTKSGGCLSRNGKWLAYNATDSGRPDVYVTPFPKADWKKPISANGGVQPMWSEDGTRLFYLDPEGNMMSVRVLGNGPEFGIPRVLFPTGMLVVAGLSQYAINPAGDQFLLIKPIADNYSTPIDVIVNWRPRQS